MPPLTTLVRSMSSLQVDGPEIARDWTPRLLHAVNHALEVRNSGDYPRARFYDMYFSDFICDQFREVQRIYAALGLEMTAREPPACAPSWTTTRRASMACTPTPPRNTASIRPLSGATSPATSNASIWRRNRRLRPARERPGDDAGVANARYGPPLEVLRLDEVPMPAPGPGELRVRVQAIPLNLNDLERITGGNMMVRAELPYSPGMEVMGVVDACGAGAEAWLRQARRRDAEGRRRRLRRVRALPAVSDLRDARAIPLPDAAALYFPFHLAWLGLFDRAGPPSRRERADPRRRRRLGFGRHPARGARRCARLRHGRHRGEGGAVPRTRRRRRDQLRRRGTSRRSCSRRPATAAST